MAVHSSFATKFLIPVTETRLPVPASCSRVPMRGTHIDLSSIGTGCGAAGRAEVQVFRVSALDRNSGGSGGDGGSIKGASSAVPNSNYVVPLDNSSSSCITRPLAEILRDLNKRIPDNIIKSRDHHRSTFLTWYHANRMLSFYAPGWCGEIRDVIFSDIGSVTVVYRVTVRGSDGEAHRESTGTATPGNVDGMDLVAAAEEIAFCRACARFGLGLYLYQEE